MNGNDRDPRLLPAPNVVEQLVRTLRLERDPDGQAGRQHLLNLLDRVTDPHDRRPPVERLRDALALTQAALAQAVPCDELVGDEPVGDVSAGVARVMDRLAAEDRAARGLADARDALGPVGLGGGTWHGPVRDWQQEIDLLIDTGPVGLDTARQRLAARGEHRRIESILGVPDDAGFVRAVVELLGGDWSAGYGALYESARRALGHARPLARTRVSGLSGADPVDVETLGAVLRAPVHDVPRVLSRKGLIAHLVSGLDEPKRLVQVLVGESGYGKTTVALALAQHAEEQHITTMCVPAADLDALVDGLQQAATLLRATASEVEAALAAPPGRQVASLWELLDRSQERWLLVLDDAGADAVGDDGWLHRSDVGTVIITSRHGTPASWGPHAEVTTVGTLDDDEGARLLIDSINTSGSGGKVQDQARALSRMLTGMPLALTSISTLITSRAGTLHDVVQSVAPAAGTPAVDTLYRVCLEVIKPEHRGQARRLLHLLACFAPDTPLAVSVLDDVPEREWDGIDGLAELRRVGLLEEQSVGRHAQPCLRIHLAVAECSRRDPLFDGPAATDTDLRAIQLLHIALARLDPGLPASWFWIRRLEPHVAEIAGSAALVSPQHRFAALRLAARTAEMLAIAGSPIAAATLLDRAAARVEAHAVDDPAVLEARQVRAWMRRLDARGDLAAVEEELAALLADRERVLGAEHPDTLATADALATVQAERGLLEPAREAFARVLHIRSALLGVEHPDTLTTRHRLAWVLCLSGQESQAVAELTRVHELRRARFGPDHLEVFSTRYRLAWALNWSGRHATAEEQFRQLHGALATALGPRHPKTLLARSRYAWTLAHLSRYREALEIYADLLVVQSKVLGANHPRVLSTRHSIACVQLVTGHTAEAIEEFAAITERRMALLGPDHPHTLDSRSYRAWAVLQAGRADTAEREFRALLADRIRVLGPDHPSTLVSRHLVCRATMRRGRLGEAEQELGALVQDELRLLDADDRNVLHARHSLAHVRGLRGWHEQCERELHAVLADRTRVLGPDHRETMVTGDVLSWLLGISGRPVDGLEVCARVLANRQRVLGAAHPHTLTSRYRQAWLTGLTGQISESTTQLTDLLPDLVAVHGVHHPDTLRCRASLLRHERLRGDLQCAEAEGRQLILDQTAVQGPTAVETLRAREERGRVLLALGDYESATTELDTVLQIRLRALGKDHPETRRGRRYLKLAVDGRSGTGAWMQGDDLR